MLVCRRVGMAICFGTGELTHAALILTERRELIYSHVHRPRRFNGLIANRNLKM